MHSAGLHFEYAGTSSKLCEGFGRLDPCFGEVLVRSLLTLMCDAMVVLKEDLAFKELCLRLKALTMETTSCNRGRDVSFGDGLLVDLCVFRECFAASLCAVKPGVLC